MGTDILKQAILNQVKNLEEKTGRKMQEWIDIANNCGLQKHGEILNHLKNGFGIGHGYANLVVHYAKQTHAGTVTDTADLLEAQYKGKENLRPWYDKLAKAIQAFGTDVEISPKKAYVSFRRKKQFAIIQPSLKTRMDIGLNIKGVEPMGKVEAAGTWNSMCTHRVKLEQEEAINHELLGWIRKSYDQAG